MSKRALSLLSCVVLVGFFMVGCPSSDPVVNELPEGERLEQYNQAIVEVENEEELEN